MLVTVFCTLLLLLFVELPWGLCCSILSPWPLVAPYPSAISRLGFFLWHLLRLGFEVLRSWLWILPSFGGCSLSLFLVVLAWLLQLFCCPDNLGFLDFLLGFPLDFQCLLVVRDGCFSVALLSGWVYGADALSFHFLVSTGFFFSIF